MMRPCYTLIQGVTNQHRGFFFPKPHKIIIQPYSNPPSQYFIIYNHTWKMLWNIKHWAYFCQFEAEQQLYQMWPCLITFLFTALLLRRTLMPTEGFLTVAVLLTGSFISHTVILNPCLGTQLCNRWKKVQGAGCLHCWSLCALSFW